MAKAAKISIPDMIKRHAEIYRETDRMYEVGGDDACDTEEYRELSNEELRLNGLILAVRASRKSDVATKWRFILKHADILDQDQGCLGWLIEAIIRLDADAVGAALPWGDGDGPASEYWPAREVGRVAANDVAA
jgi:hypothetical protein